MISSLLWLLLPAAAAAAAVPSPQHPEVTPPPSLPSPLAQRGLISAAESYADSIVTGLGSDVSAYIASGVPQFFQALPTGAAVLSSLGIDDADLAATPTQVLNLPAYGNWTAAGWNVRVHGNVYKMPNISEAKLDGLADVFLVGTAVKDLPPAQQSQARNLTAEIFVVQQRRVNVTVVFETNSGVQQGGDGGAVNAAGGAQTIQLPGETTDEGDFGTWVVLANTSSSGSGGFLVPGNETTRVQTLGMRAVRTDSGNATAYLVPPTGVTVVSDIDDILRVTKIWDPREGLLNSFARPFVPWLDMPAVYSNWSASWEDMHFHYLTTTPEQVTRNYMDFIFKTYPPGSFDTRPLNFSDVSATLSIRKFLLDRVFETFPLRKFILVGDTSNSDVMEDYPQLTRDFPGQVLCILLRNSSSMDATDRFPYDTSGFVGLPQDQYMFFNVPDDLAGLDLAGGRCHNTSVRQNVTFGTQGLPFGLGTKSSAMPGRLGQSSCVLGLGLLAVVNLFVFL